MNPESKYEAVIGLEIHVQLQTLSKAFSSDSIEYGALPNTQVSPISLGHPGTLPKHNADAVKKAIMIGLALKCDITRYNRYARKNYFYADLPKGYQITQFDTPLCVGGTVDIKLPSGEEKSIRLIRIHMEEDTGKSMHDQDLYDTLVDYNRAGTALIEIVSEPDIRTGDEAYAFVSEIRRLVRYLDICDGNMEEGSLRCDANVSIRLKGSTTFGTKVEVKNMNSISNVKRAIDFEINRQSEILDRGGVVDGETRGFNGLAGTTFSLRKKEGVTDYRYFPEPDLPPTVVSDEMLRLVREEMPELPRSMYARFTSTYGLSDYDASVLIDDKHSALYFEKIVANTPKYKLAANWVTGPIRGYLNENALGIDEFAVPPTQISELLLLIDEGIINHTSASQQVFPKLVENPHENPRKLVETLGIATVKDTTFIEDLIQEVLKSYPEKVQEYKNGKVGLIGLFVGEVMKKSQGKADPKSTNELVRKHLDQAN